MAGLDELHRHGLEDEEEYRRAWAEEDVIGRVAIHVNRFRHQANITQEELARRLRKRQPWVSRLEAGQENVTLRTLGRLAYALQCDATELVAPIAAETTANAH